MLLEIWSDIACPWCYIGKRRLEAALAAFEAPEEVEIIWRSFELDPAAPPERPGPLVEQLARKYGLSREQAQESQRALEATAAAAGLAIDFSRVRSGSTFDGHRLVQLAAEHGTAGQAVEALLRAYFSGGRLIADPDTLRAVGVETGLPAGEVDELLGGERFADAVRADEQTAQELGLRGVPTFIVDRTVGVTGAQPPELLLQMLRRGRATSPA